MAASDGLALAAARRLPVAVADWTAELRASLRTADELAEALDLTPEELEGARRAEREGLPIRITPYYLSLCDRHDPRCPIRLQCVPRAEEAHEVPGDLADPLGEVAHEVAPHLVQRYPAASTAASAPARAWSGTAAARSRWSGWRPRSPTWRRTPRCATSSSAGAIR
jgi:lysine 2,3-aminomutase